MLIRIRDRRVISNLAALLSFFLFSLVGKASTLTVLIEDRPQSLDPLTATDAIGQKTIALVYAGLVRLNAELQPEPDLADLIENKDNSKFHFRLKPEAKFHDGERVKAVDVARCLLALRDNKSSRLAASFSDVKDVRALNEFDVLVETARPMPYLLWDLNAAKIYKRNAQGSLIGSGEFSIEEQDRSEVRLKRRAESSLPSQIVLQFVKDETTRFQRFYRGDADATLSSLSPTKMAYLTKHDKTGTGKKIVQRTWPGTSFQYIGLNFKNSVLAKHEVREALMLSIDRDKIESLRSKGYTTRADGLLSPLHKEFNPKLPIYGYDPARAKALLAKAGVQNLELEIKLGSDKTARDFARILQESFAQIGVHLKIRVLETGTLFSDLKKGQFDLYLSRWVGIANASILARALHTSQIGSGNRGAYSNPKLDSILDSMMSARDKEKRFELAAQAQEIVAKDLPYLFLWHWNHSLITAGNIQLTGGKENEYPNGDFRVFARLKPN